MPLIRFLQNMTVATLVFANFKFGATNDELWTGTLDGVTHTQITSAGFEADDPVVSPDGTKIIYTRSTGSRFGPTGIALCNVDGSGYTQLVTAASASFTSVSPAWNPNSTSFCFVSNNGTSGPTHRVNVEKMNTDGSGRTVLYTSATDVHRPQFNYDGSKIGFLEFNSGTGNYDIVVMNADGSSPTVAKSDTVPSGVDEAIAWAYASNKIAFLNTDFTIHTINSDGTGEATISSGANWTWITRAAWHPDDSNVVAGQLSAGNYKLYNCAANGSGVTALSPAISMAGATLDLPFVFGSRIYFKKIVGATSTFVSTALSGSGERTEDTPAANIGIQQNR